MISASRLLPIPLLRNTAIAVVDQGLISASGFLISVLLVKTVSKPEYGYYAIALAVSLLLGSIQNALVGAPMSVLLAAKDGEDRQRYLSSLAWGQLLVILPASLAAAVALRLAGSWILDPASQSVAAALAAAAIGLLWREFLRSFHFARETPGDVLRMDALYVAILAVALCALAYLFRITVASIWLVVGVASLVSALPFGRGFARRPDAAWTAFRENWTFGRWAILGVLVTHIQTYSHLYLLGALAGSVAVADASAARLLMMPMALAQIGWGKVAIPHGSALRQRGQLARFFREQTLACLAFLAAITVYVVVLFQFSGAMQGLLLSDKYASAFRYVTLWGAIFAVGFATVSASSGLQVAMKFSFITKASLAVMPVTVGASYVLIRGSGIGGALAALLLGESLLAVILWIGFRRAVVSLAERRPAEGEPAPGSQGASSESHHQPARGRRRAAAGRTISPGFENPGSKRVIP